MKTLAVGVAACATMAYAGYASTGSRSDRTIEIGINHSTFDPNRVVVEEGETVTFVITNDDPIDHEFIIGPQETHDIHERGEPHFHTGAVPGEVTVPAGATVETTWTFPPAGGTSVAFGCHLAGHWTYGMHGKALVS